MKKIGILGGTFDPPHIGHLIIAETVRTSLDLDEIWFMPTNEPPHKNKANSTGLDRLKMVKLATEDNEYFKVNDIEMKRLGKSFTFDTMNILMNEYKNEEFFFIIGADMVEYLPSWSRIDELVQLVKFVGVQREGYELNSPYPFIKVDIPMIDISSTWIRKRLGVHASVKYLIPESVDAYIKENQLYENR
ncbi:MAG TPA: nicotinate-nucleotide adenylyltransferase [Candidatus Dormibacteraeota bacterium]|nr:nicotinate-nucleotide adenylyltransferase [Candidatus Dormibacteraeota bacterium]